jgi:hypothetical protein
MMGLQPVVDAQEQADEKRNELFVTALNDCELIPKADPNTASQTERYLKTTALKQIQQGNPNIDQDKVDLHAMHVLGVDDAESYFKPPPPPGAAPPNPEEMEANAALLTAQARLKDSDTKSVTAQTAAKVADGTLAFQQQEMQSKENIAHLGVARELIIHNSEQQAKQQGLASENQQRSLDRVHQFQLKALSNRADAIKVGLGNRHEATQNAFDRTHELATQALGHHVDATQADLDRQHALDLQKQKPAPGVAQ